MPRGRAIGVTLQLPKWDKYIYPREYLLDRLAVMMGGRSAERLVFDSATSGAENDLKQATQLARKMVLDWGMSEALGPLALGADGQDVFVPGDTVESIPLLISGSVQVCQIGESGREVTLYRFRPGESCVLTANSILSAQLFPAIATVEEDAEALMVPAEAFGRWVGQHHAWREFVFDLVSQRLASVMEIVDDVAFRRLDARMAAHPFRDRARTPARA